MICHTFQRCSRCTGYIPLIFACEIVPQVLEELVVEPEALKLLIYFHEFVYDPEDRIYSTEQSLKSFVEFSLDACLQVCFLYLLVCTRVTRCLCSQRCSRRYAV